MNKAENVGRKLKALRKQTGLSQNNIARFLDVDQSLISMAENGKRALTSDMLEKLAALYGVQLSAFHDEIIEFKPLSLALRASDITEEDLEAISSINRIALNCSFITDLLEDSCANG